MPKSNSYYPSRNGDQIIWLRNFRNKLAPYQAPLGYTAPEVTAILGDADRCIYLLDTVQSNAQSFAESVTASIDVALNGTGTTPVALPAFALPAVPVPPATVAPGALRRIFAFIANLKTRPGYTAAIGDDLQLVATATPDDPLAVPLADAEARSGEVLLTFKKQGRLGVWIESQTAAETEWTFLAIDTTNPYNDARPLKVAGQPEKRRYRLCFWDGEPTKVWTATLEVVFGG